LEDPNVTAIEADILMGKVDGGGDEDPVPIMAHPPKRSSDLSFEEFLTRCIRDRRRHLKLDFKELLALELCLPVVAKWRQALADNKQAVWVNADVVPGPGRRRQPCAMPAEAVLAAVKASCPGVHLSLGWTTRVESGQAYSKEDCDAMAAVCTPENTCGGGVVFAAAVRAAESRGVNPLADLVRSVPGSQLLLWTGTGEPPIDRRSYQKLLGDLAIRCIGGRMGLDCQVTNSGLVVIYATIYMWLMWLKWLLGL